MKRVFFVLLFLVLCGCIFGWEVKEGKDQFGDPNGEYSLIQGSVSISFHNSPLFSSNISIYFGSSKYGFYQARSHLTELKKSDGSVLSYWSTSMYGSDAYEVIETLLSNKETKVYMFWDYGYGDSQNLIIPNKGLEEGLDKLFSIWESKFITDSWIVEYGEYPSATFYSVCNKGKNKYLACIHAKKYSSGVGIDFKVYKYFSENYYEEIDEDRGYQWNQSVSVTCGKDKGTFDWDWPFDYYVYDNDEVARFKSLISKDSLATVIIPSSDGKIEVSFPTSEIIEYLNKV